MPKQFYELRNEATDPFDKLYYEIMLRFHSYDTFIALGSMSQDLKDIMIECTKKIDFRSANPNN